MAALLDGAVYEAEQFAVEEQTRSTDGEEEGNISSSEEEMASVDSDSDEVVSPPVTPIAVPPYDGGYRSDCHDNDLRDEFKQQIKPPKRTAIDVWVPKRKAKSQSGDRGRTITDAPRPPAISQAALKEQLLLESRKHQAGQQQRVRPPQQSSSSGVKVLVMKSKSR
jgi:hypothetical protein